MLVTSYNTENDLVQLVSVPEGIPHSTLVNVERLKFIERYGVSIYDLKKLPNDI
jgi:hypothetical protein